MTPEIAEPVSRCAVLSRAVLDVLDDCPGLCVHELEDVVHDVLGDRGYPETVTVYQTFRRGVMPVPAAVELLAEFGAVDDRVITPLGRWARRALAEPADPAAGEPPGEKPAGRILQLKIMRRHVRPPVWRRVLVPADAGLALLHRIIQVAFDWDDDHLHVFTADGAGYADPNHDLDGYADETAVRLAAVLPRPGRSIDYRYDLGDCWDHTITLEKVVEPDSALTYPYCAGGCGDALVEDRVPDFPERPTPFDQHRINRRLATLGGPSRASSRFTWPAT
ncbi:plasmid pRiA4b ORF-3 family protein [Pseudonocardia asaccharolytica]|uniref:Plasmid pRiA4b Orf3-like domain-containing protein n=1 Tax=Pseudonocardia asaccharolytica DSM 44247 = NBRC 16224 TaxID=1123024 RepID=A0A511D6U7_9PSEU|nr:plasmid pRiA4b ORF-3 family protein [Pseudonocardia asaccharolytica]GEL20516.1 hypothetical protein PA7_43530 [Pseudonocardia asaccharolytica DSM 44247 = NBRC 16224]